jgi:acetyl esterase/lipase
MWSRLFPILLVLAALTAPAALAQSNSSSAVAALPSSAKPGLFSFTVTPEVSYVEPSDGIRVGDLYLPLKPGLKPVVILIHGGAWSAGSRQHLNDQAQALAQHGFAVFNIDYRLVGSGGEFPADVVDVKDALAFAAGKAALWNIDVTRMAAMGSSAGGHLAMMLGYTPNKVFAPEHYPKSDAHVKAVVSWFGPTDFVGIHHDAITKYLARVGGEKDASEASPITYAQTGVATMFVHGTKDPLVPYDQSKRMLDVLTGRHIFAQLVPIPDEGHGFSPQGWHLAMTRVLAFLDSQFAVAHK